MEYKNHYVCSSLKAVLLCTDEVWLYLDVITDVRSRAVIGRSMPPQVTAQLTCDALLMSL